MAFRRVGGALLLAMTVGVVASALLAAPHLQTTVLEQDPTEFFASEKEYAAVHPVYTRYVLDRALREVPVPTGLRGGNGSCSSGALPR